MLDAANYCAIEKLRDGRSYVIRAQRRDDNIIDALHLRAGLRTFYLRFLTRKHRLNNFEAAFYRNVDFVRQVALLADLRGEIIGGASPSYSAGLEFDLTGVAQSVELA